MKKLVFFQLLIAVFLLLNLVTGAIINNYQTVKEENDLKEKQKE